VSALCSEPRAQALPEFLPRRRVHPHEALRHRCRRRRRLAGHQPRAQVARQRQQLPSLHRGELRHHRRQRERCCGAADRPAGFRAPGDAVPPLRPCPLRRHDVPARRTPRQDAAAHQALHGRPHVVVHGQQGPDVAGGNALGMLAHHRDDLLAQATERWPGRGAGGRRRDDRRARRSGRGRRLGRAALPRQVREQVQQPQLPRLGLLYGTFQGRDQGALGRRALGCQRTGRLGRGARRVRLPWGVRAGGARWRRRQRIGIKLRDNLLNCQEK